MTADGGVANVPAGAEFIVNFTLKCVMCAALL